MCNPASFVLTKEDVFWSRAHDDHEEIITENHLSDDVIPLILRVEINPPNGDWMAPLEKWVYRVDQDILPTWADAENDEARARRALEAWAAARLVRHTPGDCPRVVESHDMVYVVNSQVTAGDNSTITSFSASSRVTLRSRAAVLIDRSGPDVKCCIGPQDVKTD